MGWLMYPPYSLRCSYPMARAAGRVRRGGGGRGSPPPAGGGGGLFVPPAVLIAVFVPDGEGGGPVGGDLEQVSAQVRAHHAELRPSVVDAGVGAELGGHVGCD